LKELQRRNVHGKSSLERNAILSNKRFALHGTRFAFENQEMQNVFAARRTSRLLQLRMLLFVLHAREHANSSSLEPVKRDNNVAQNKLFATEENATLSSRNVSGEEHQPSVAVEPLSSDGELFAVNKTGNSPRLESNVAVSIKDVKRSPTTIDVQSSRERDVGGLLLLVEMFI